MTYSNDLRMKILKCISSKKYTDIEIMNIFEISRTTFYKFKKINKLQQNRKYNILKNSYINSKISSTIRTFIQKYVLEMINRIRDLSLSCTSTIKNKF